MNYKYCSDDFDKSFIDDKSIPNKCKKGIPFNSIISEAYQIAMNCNIEYTNVNYERGISLCYKYISEFHEPHSILIAAVHQYVHIYNKSVKSMIEIDDNYSLNDELENIDEFGTTRKNEHLGIGRFQFIFENGKFHSTGSSGIVTKVPSFSILKSSSGIMDIDASLPVCFNSIILTHISSEMWDEDFLENDESKCNQSLIEFISNIGDIQLHIPWTLALSQSMRSMFTPFNFLEQINSFSDSTIYGCIMAIENDYYKLWNDLSISIFKAFANAELSTNSEENLNNEIIIRNNSCGDGNIESKYYIDFQDSVEAIMDLLYERNEFFAMEHQISSANNEEIKPVYIIGIDSLKTFFIGALYERIDCMMTDNASFFECFVHSIYLNDSSISIIDVANMIFHDIIDTREWKDIERILDLDTIDFFNGVFCMIRIYIKCLSNFLTI